MDAFCDAFEAAWLAGHQPRIEDFLPRGDPAHQDMLLHELLLAEWDLRRRHDQHIELQTYLGRFPESRQSITDLWRASNERPSDSVLNARAVDATQDGAAQEGVGTVVDRFKLLEKLGEGGFGTVWAAEQRQPVKRRVALKLIKLGMDTKQVVARFEAERQALALMDHPNIAKVFDAGATETGRPFFVMELVRGIPITKYCDQERLATHNRLDLFIKVCHAIQHAHQKGIIHRDIKPSNILVTLHDGVPVPKVIDFGVAKAIQQELTEKTIYTQLAQFIGTPAYMSPEQAEMSGLDIDTRSDIYSLGVLLYELLTGATPFDGKELMRSGLDAMRKIIREKEPLTPSSRLTKDQQTKNTGLDQSFHDLPRSAIDRDLDWIVMKCLEKDRSRRYETASGLAMDIHRHMNNEPILARSPSATYKLRKFVRRNRSPVMAAAALVLVLSLGLVGTTVGLVWANREAGRAQSADLDATRLRERAQTREKIVKAQLLCDQLRFDEAEEMMSRIPAPALHTERGDAAIVFRALTDFHARHVRWKETLPHATKAVECEPTDVINYVSLLALLAAHGDLENYRHYCRELLHRFREPKNIVDGEMIAKVCLMLPSSGVDLALVERLADGGLKGRSNNAYISYSQFAKGLAEYRQGRFASAADWMRKSIADPFYGHGHSRYVQSYMVLAMAQHQLNEHEEARAAFAKGREIEETKLPKIDSGDLGPDWYWRDWIVAHALMNEAKTLIEGKPPAGDE